jgi:hypothetical protein
MVKIAGWSSQVARQAHNLKVVGSNPTPATTFKALILNRLRFFSFLYVDEIGQNLGHFRGLHQGLGTG